MEYLREYHYNLIEPSGEVRTTRRVIAASRDEADQRAEEIGLLGCELKFMREAELAEEEEEEGK